MLPPFTNALVLTGPTGSGKTRLALQLAERLDAEIVSMDSMALYRGMDIGTAKPTTDERRHMPHHLVDVLDPWESASVAWWLEQAGNCCRDIEARGKQALFVGGTPLYLKAMLFGLFDGPPANDELRSRLEQECQRLGSPVLHERLAGVDPATAARLHPNDARRILRALEVHELTGQPISAWQTQWTRLAVSPTRPPDSEQDEIPRILWLDPPRADLYNRINARVEAMFAAGLVDEVRSLLRLEKPLSREAGQALGYKEVIAHLAGEGSLKETIVQVQTRTRNFAKRQITWFRHLPGCRAATSELTGDLWQPKMKQ